MEVYIRTNKDSRQVIVNQGLAHVIDAQDGMEWTQFCFVSPLSCSSLKAARAAAKKEGLKLKKSNQVAVWSNPGKKNDE